MEDEQDGIKAKSVSLWGKIAMAVIAMGAYTVKAMGYLPGMTVQEMSIALFTVYGIFLGTVDANIVIQNAKSKGT